MIERREPPPEIPWTMEREQPTDVLRWAASALSGIFHRMLGVALQPSADPGPPSPELADVGACITMMTPTGSWNLGLTLPRKDAERVARNLLGMDPDEVMDEETIPDAVGEVANLLAGGIKNVDGEVGRDWRVGLPIYLEGSSWFRRAPQDTKLAAQQLLGNGIRLQIVLCWRQGGL